jgi:large subunit ribosomal protein L25
VIEPASECPAMSGALANEATMEKTLQLETEVRTGSGSKQAAQLRKQGRLPGIVYGRKMDPVAVSLNAHDFLEGLHHGHRLMDLRMAGASETVLIKELQYDHLGKYIIHVDLLRVNVTDTVKVAVAVQLKGVAKGALEGGIVEAHASAIEVECLVTAIPQVIAVSIKDLIVGQAIHASDVVLPEGVKLASSPELLIATCHVVAEVKSTEEVEEETPAAPEVIREAKKAEEGEAPAEKEKQA